ncbi:MAG: hypothetical protein ACJ780_12205 [Solirubrobacteraceae bacterium]|jgi:hypothetical protein
MPTTPDQEATMAQKPPTRRQINYLKALAECTGQTFPWPHSSAAASREITRLKTTRASTGLERAIERFGDRQATEAAQGAAAIHGFEVVGYGSTAAWSQRS